MPELCQTDHDVGKNWCCQKLLYHVYGQMEPCQNLEGDLWACNNSPHTPPPHLNPPPPPIHIDMCITMHIIIPGIFVAQESPSNMFWQSNQSLGHYNNLISVVEYYKIFLAHRTVYMKSLHYYTVGHKHAKMCTNNALRRQYLLFMAVKG